MSSIKLREIGYRSLRHVLTNHPELGQKMESSRSSSLKFPPGIARQNTVNQLRAWTTAVFEDAGFEITANKPCVIRFHRRTSESFVIYNLHNGSSLSITPL